jgi:hypothetical protein
VSALSEYGQWQAERERNANSPRPKPYEVGAVVPETWPYSGKSVFWAYVHYSIAAIMALLVLALAAAMYAEALR